MPRPATALCSVGVAILLLAGCTTPTPPSETGQSPTPSATVEAPPSPSASASPSPEPVVIAPQRPAAMDDDGYKGAAAAAEYFKLLDDYIMKTGDTAEFEAMSHQECSTCDNRLEQARQIHESRSTYLGGETTVQIKHIYEQDNATGIWPIDVQTSVEPVTLLDANDVEVQSLDATSGLQRVEVLRIGDRWVIVGVSGLEEQP